MHIMVIYLMPLPLSLFFNTQKKWVRFVKEHHLCFLRYIYSADEMQSAHGGIYFLIIQNGHTTRDGLRWRASHLSAPGNLSDL